MVAVVSCTSNLLGLLNNGVMENGRNLQSHKFTIVVTSAVDDRQLTTD